MRDNVLVDFQAIGGTEGCRKLSAAFYARVQRDPVLRPLFPGKTMKCAIDEFAAFLVQFLGGPPEDSQKRWWVSLRESHARFKIGSREREAWMRNMTETLAELGIGGELRQFFEHSSSYIAHGADDRPHGHIGERWTAQRAADDAVAAIRAGDASAAIAHTERAVAQAGLLHLMVRSGDARMLEYVRGRLLNDPSAVHERYGGRTLLHTSAGVGNAEMVRFLLSGGADPHVKTNGGHTALYCVANECVSGGGDVVRTLIRAGARVDACDGVQRCTPLHMAARRGNVEIAEALLDCGAAIDALDRNGNTPWQRAMNCRKAAVARLIEARKTR